ncbi:MAG: translation initiation factor [Candidatus Woesearchaeota archaeon]
MSDVCPKCGLPKDLCVCATIAKEEQKIQVKTVKRKFGKVITLVQGIDSKSLDIKGLAKKLKSKLACGGTVKQGIIELQGSHVLRVKVHLVELGFPKESIQAG